MTTVSQLLDEKGRQVWSVGPDASVLEAIRLLAEKNVGIVVVLDGKRPVGVFSERDYTRSVYLKGKASPTTKVSDVMHHPIICAYPDETVEECMAVMTEKHIRHLPVVENGELVGIVSIGDLVKAMIAHQKFLIEQLEHYIKS